MPKGWCRIKTFSKGFSPIEVLLASTLFGVLVTAMIGALVYGQASTSNAGDRERAVLLADEGVQAVRAIRNLAYGGLANGTYGLAQTAGKWVFSGSSDTTGIYTRQVVISEIDSTRKSVVVTVTWPQGATTAQTAVATRFTDWVASFPATVTSGPIIMTYSKTTATPFYRTWDGTEWSAEAAAQDVVGTINYVVVKSSKTRNEAIMGTQTSTGAIYIQIWDGTTWGNLTQVGTGPTTTRSFDIAYEQNSGRAVIAYTPSSGSADFAYRTWDGATLSGATTITAPPTTGALNWLELRQNPLSASNEIAMIMLDANIDVYGMVWTGSAWSNMGTSAVWDASASIATRKAIDIEYEQISGKAMFMWGDSVATDQYYRTWNGTTLGGATLLDIAAQGGVTNWLQLAARPNSNEIMVGVQDAGSDLNTRKWSGTAWDTATQHPEHAATVENIASRAFDIVWETHSANVGKAWILWGNGTTVTSRPWSGTAWGTAAIMTGSDDSSFIRTRADPISGAIFAGIYQNSSSAGNARDITERRLTDGGSVWPAKTVVWAGPTGADPVHFRIDIATP